MEVERYHGQLVKVGESTVMSHTIAGAWSILYIEFPPDEWEDYWNALRKERVKILRTFRDQGVIVFE